MHCREKTYLVTKFIFATDNPSNVVAQRSGTLAVKKHVLLKYMSTCMPAENDCAVLVSCWSRCAAERQDLRPPELEEAHLLRGRPQHALHRGVRDPDADRAPAAVHGLPGVSKTEGLWH